MDLFFEKFKQIGLSSAIAILTPFVIHHAIQMVTPQPHFVFANKKELSEKKDLLFSLEKEKKILLGTPVPIEITTPEGKLRWNAQLVNNEQEKYSALERQIIDCEHTIKNLENLSEEEDARWRKTVEYHYNRKYFFCALILGLLILLFGLAYKTGSVGLGFIFGGLLTILNGYFHFWQEMSHFLKVISLLIPIIIIIRRGTETYKQLNKE